MKRQSKAGASPSSALDCGTTYAERAAEHNSVTVFEPTATGGVLRYAGCAAFRVEAEQRALDAFIQISRTPVARRTSSSSTAPLRAVPDIGPGFDEIVVATAQRIVSERAAGVYLLESGWGKSKLARCCSDRHASGLVLSSRAPMRASRLGILREARRDHRGRSGPARPDAIASAYRAARGGVAV